MSETPACTGDSGSAAGFSGTCGGGAAGAGALHLEIDHAVAEAAGHDVAAKRKREDAENILPCLVDLFAPLEPGSDPHPSPRDDQTV